MEYGTTNQKRDFFLDTKEKYIYIYIIKMKVLFNQTKQKKTLQTEQNLMQYTYEQQPESSNIVEVRSNCLLHSKTLKDKSLLFVGVELLLQSSKTKEVSMIDFRP